MGTLTKTERDGLEDVFLSIHTNSGYNKFKNISTYSIYRNTNNYIHLIVKRAKLGLRDRKLTHFLSYLAKKKKNLSK